MRFSISLKKIQCLLFTLTLYFVKCRIKSCIQYDNYLNLAQESLKVTYLTKTNLYKICLSAGKQIQKVKQLLYLIIYLLFIGKKNPHEKVQPEAGGVHRPTSDTYKTAGGGETGEHSGRAGSSGSKVSASVNLTNKVIHVNQ